MGAGRPKKFNEEKALDRAMQLFWKKGYANTSTEDLLEAMDISKGSMYNTFGGKREVFTQVIDKYFRDLVIYFSSQFRDAKEPIDFLHQFFRKMAERNTAEHKMGCFMGNSLTEFSSQDAGLEKKAIDVMKTFESMMEVEIRKAQSDGRLQTKEDSKMLASCLLNLWNGVNVTARIYPDNNKIGSLVDFQLALFFK